MITGTTPGIFVKHPSTLADESWSMQLPDLALLPSFVLKVLFVASLLLLIRMFVSTGSYR